MKNSKSKIFDKGRVVYINGKYVTEKEAKILAKITRPSARYFFIPKLD